MSLRSDLRRAFRRDATAAAGVIAIALIVALAIFAPLLTPQNPYDLSQLSVVDGRLPPGASGETGQLFLLGSDEQGRDVWSAILYGLRTSLLVGAASVFLSLALGAALGIAAGYFRGWFDAVLMRIVDLQLSIPSILIALILLAALGKGVDKVIVALVAAQWAIFARVARAGALIEREKDYAAAARCLGLSRLRIIFRHIAPNCLPPLLVLATLNVAGAISLEATLSFLGLGVPITRPSLGLLIANGFEYLLSGRYWISVFPGLALVATIVSINLVGDKLARVLNPRAAP